MSDAIRTHDKYTLEEWLALPVTHMYSGKVQYVDENELVPFDTMEDFVCLMLCRNNGHFIIKEVNKFSRNKYFREGLSMSEAITLTNFGGIVKGYELAEGKNYGPFMDKLVQDYVAKVMLMNIMPSSTVN